MPSQKSAATAAATAATATAAATQYVDHGEYNINNISQNRICAGEYMHVNWDSYILCIPHVSNETTKMDVARAVEQYILKTGNIEHFKYVKKVIFVRAFDETVFNTATTSTTTSATTSATTSEYIESNAWYKIAMVLIDIPHGYDEYGVEIYTDHEEAFYDSVCRGDLVVGTWTDAFFMANPKKYRNAINHSNHSNNNNNNNSNNNKNLKKRYASIKTAHFKNGNTI
jgi:hypothetical protein